MPQCIEEILKARNVKIERISFYAIFLHQHSPKKSNIHYSNIFVFIICEEYLRQEDLASADVKDIHRRNIENQKCQISKDISLCKVSTPTLTQKKKRNIHIHYMSRKFAPGRFCISRCQGYSSKEGSAFLMWRLQTNVISV